MFRYYVALSLQSLRRNRALTALMIVALALGIGASMTTLTVWHVLSGDPLPGKSGSLFYPQMDPRDMSNYQPGAEMAKQLTWQDGMHLLHAKRADRQALMTGGDTSVQAADGRSEPQHASGRYTTADFFPMFETPFLYGHAWNEADDNARTRVVVLGSEMNDRLFHGEDSTGKSVRVGEVEMRVIGVLAPWRPVPHFYDLNTGKYRGEEDIFVPLTTARDAKLGRAGGVTCWGKGSGDEDAMETAECVWLQFWVEIDSVPKVAAYREFLGHYVDDQKAAGRFVRPVQARLLDLNGWLQDQRVVPGDVRLQVWLALAFFVVCLINTVGLMLAKFLRRSGEVGVRRALGASRRSVFAQLLTEAGMVGFAGGVGGLGLALAGLWLVRQQPASYAKLAHLDLTMLALTFVVAVCSAVVAGLLPAWRACQVAPALQLKTQ